MYDLVAPVARWLNDLLPHAVRLPSLTFELPHEAYWLGLVLFPFAAMFLVRRAERRGPAREAGELVKPSIAWLLWIGGGIVGLHRFYLRAGMLGFVYIGLFVCTLYGSNNAFVSRNAVSEAANLITTGKFDIEHYARQAEAGAEGAAKRLADARAAFATAESDFAAARRTHDSWITFAGAGALVIFLLMLWDAARMGQLIERCREIEATLPPPREALEIERRAPLSARRRIETPFTRAIGAINGFVGHYVAYWSVLAVAVYYFEVVARYVFNSPTNWAHESMFLMFGMQYLLSGGYCLREDSHVRVDVIYERLPERARAVTDLVTSIFFFIFTVTLLVTGFIFAADSIGVREVSFTEWGIQYWPVKCAIAIGALLITLQGLTNVIQDITYLVHGKA